MEIVGQTGFLRIFARQVVHRRQRFPGGMGRVGLRNVQRFVEEMAHAGLLLWKKRYRQVLVAVSPDGSMREGVT